MVASLYSSTLTHILKADAVALRGTVNRLLADMAFGARQPGFESQLPHTMNAIVIYE